VTEGKGGVGILGEKKMLLVTKEITKESVIDQAGSEVLMEVKIRGKNKLRGKGGVLRITRRKGENDEVLLIRRKRSEEKNGGVFAEKGAVSYLPVMEGKRNSSS